MCAVLVFGLSGTHKVLKERDARTFLQAATLLI
jgi:hypothetical protein